MSRGQGALSCNCSSGSAYRPDPLNNLFHATYGALGVLATSQCTINNFIFDNATHQYFETISGGSGPGPDVNGTSVLQTHMTNSRLTDPEVPERWVRRSPNSTA